MKLLWLFSICSLICVSTLSAQSLCPPAQDYTLNVAPGPEWCAPPDVRDQACVDDKLNEFNEHMIGVGVGVCEDSGDACDGPFQDAVSDCRAQYNFCFRNNFPNTAVCDQQRSECMQSANDQHGQCLAPFRDQLRDAYADAVSDFYNSINEDCCTRHKVKRAHNASPQGYVGY